jgi:hypothetical protein
MFVPDGRFDHIPRISFGVEIMGSLVFSGLHGIVDDAYLKERRIAGSRLIKRLQRLGFRAVGLPSHIPDI